MDELEGRPTRAAAIRAPAIGGARRGVRR